MQRKDTDRRGTGSVSEVGNGVVCKVGLWLCSWW